MLVTLHISNLALIDDLRLEFEAGLNLLTGETGSGKSIIVDSLGLLIGERSSADLIKIGCQQGFVEGLFILPENQKLELLLTEAGIINETGENCELLIRRELSVTGRNRVFINNQMATQGFLRSIGPFLADIHGQGDQQSLFKPETHLNLLDAYAGLDESRQEVAVRFKAWAALRKALAELRTDEDKRLQMLDLLRFQVEELGRAELSVEEEILLEEERRRLNNIEKLATLTGELFANLYEDNESVVTRLGPVEKQLTELAGFDSSFADFSEGLATANSLLEDLAFAVREFGSRLELSPQRLAEVEDRLAELSRIKRKYGGTLAAAIEHLALTEEKLNLIEDSSVREAEIEAQLKFAKLAYLEAASRAHEGRLKAKAKFEKKLVEALAGLAMDKARFVCHIEGDSEAEQAFSERGYTRLEFYFSANPGEPPRPLARVASGGEASRLMLVLKTLSREGNGSGTAVFDEVDSGIGGRVAEAVGRRLKNLARSEQVLCVTHHPQVAALADHHFCVTKETDGTSTVVHVAKLLENERIEELARMLTGAKVTNTARQHAAEMLLAQTV